MRNSAAAVMGTALCALRACITMRMYARPSQGYLTKEPMKHRGGVVGIGGKQRRYFRLYTTSITYAQNESATKVKGKLILDTTASVELISAGGRSFTVTSTDNQSCLRLQVMTMTMIMIVITMMMTTTTTTTTTMIMMIVMMMRMQRAEQCGLCVCVCVCVCT